MLARPFTGSCFSKLFSGYFVKDITDIMKGAGFLHKYFVNNMKSILSLIIFGFCGLSVLPLCWAKVHSKEVFTLSSASGLLLQVLILSEPFL